MNLLKTFFGIGGMTTISRILGFIRDTVIARIFGAGLESDAFFVAFKIPNLLRRISAEGSRSLRHLYLYCLNIKQKTPLLS
jgi:putative peptidoglycan lipid II flippase